MFLRVSRFWCELDDSPVSGVFPCISWSSSSTDPGMVFSSMSPSRALGPAGGIAGGSSRSSVAVFGFCGVSATAWKFSSGQRSLTRRTQRANTVPSSALTRCSSVRSLVPSHTPCFYLSNSFGAGFPDPFPTSGSWGSKDSPNSNILHGANQISSVCCQLSVCAGFFLAVLRAMCELVFPTVSDRFQVLHCCDEIVSVRCG